MSKKLSKEDFVQGHTGSSLTEITFIASAPAVLLLIDLLLSYSKHPRKSIIIGFLQFIVLVVPQIAQVMGPLTPAAVFGVLLIFAAILVAINFQLLRRERSKVPLLAMR